VSIANTEQAEHWNTGPGVAHWVANQARYDRMHAPFTALDLSGPMLARAQADAEAAGLGNVAFQQGDAQVESLEPGRFDTVISRFGVMFFADPVAAFANIRSATRPGGRLVFACWQPQAANQWMLVPGAALAEHLPPPAPAPADGPGMFAFADPDRLRPILAAAGWRDVEITSEHASILVGGGGSVDDAVEFLRPAPQAPRRRRRQHQSHQNHQHLNPVVLN